MRKTKIVCTIGPATKSEDMMKKLIEHGMNVARFNFSHGSHEYHKECLETLRKAAAELKLPVASMMDTKGPEVRLGRFVDDKPVEIKNGDIYTLTTENCLCTDKIGSVTFKKLPEDVTVGTRILINDGVIELLAEKVTATEIVCRIIHGGRLSNNKGINVPGVKLSMPYLSDADMSDLEFGAKMKYDFIAASFVRTAADINYPRRYTQSLGWFNARIIAKIENLEGVENIDEILEAADGIMVARGDMGVEIPFEKIPAIQKDLIHKGYNAGKQVITATQMLESMIMNPRPTRAEVTDVANAIYDGTSAIMLSGESAAGAYPVEAVKTMARIAERAEKDIDYISRFSRRNDDVKEDVTTAISHACCTTAIDLEAAAIITVTMSGFTASMVARYQPACPVIGCTVDKKVFRQLGLVWGVQPLLINREDSAEKLFDSAVEASKKAGFVQTGDRVVLTAGVPLGISGKTNMLRVVDVE